MRLFPPLRFVITTRCPNNCPHCHKEGCSDQKDLSREFLLSILKSAFAMGFLEVTLTGGEPTLRSDLVDIVKDIHSIEKHCETKLSTCGYRLAECASDLREAGLINISVSLLSLRDSVCKEFTGEFSRIEKAIDAAKDAGLHVDLNTVLMKRINGNEVLSIIEYAAKKEVDLTFMTLVWIPRKDIFYNKHFMSVRQVAELLFTKSSSVSIVVRSAPKLVFSMPNGLKISLKSKRLSRLIHMPMCKHCQYDQKCTEGFYAIRIAGSGEVYPCLLSTFRAQLKESMTADEISRGLHRTMEHVFGKESCYRSKTWFDYIDKNNEMSSINC